MRAICRDYRSGEQVTVTLENGKVGLRREKRRSETRYLFAPVFVDLQVNGYGGVDFSRPETLSPDNVYSVVQSLWSQGVGFFLPTIVTGSFESTLASLERIVASRQNPAVAASIPGYHLEGPYISAEDGPRGAHAAEHVRFPSWSELSRWQEAAGGLIKLVTLAPELPGALSFIDKLGRAGVLAATGHTNANTRELSAAVAAGAKLSTHLGNGAHARLPRHPNYLWDQLAHDELWASLIVDGHHLPPNVVKSMVRAKGPERCILVSDAAPVAGLAPGRYRFAGSDIDLESNGRVQLAGTGYLAGSTLSMADAVHKVTMFAGLDPATALAMASLTPCELLRRATSLKLEPFSDRTFNLLHWQDDSLQVVATVIAGKVLYLRENDRSD